MEGARAALNPPLILSHSEIYMKVKKIKIYDKTKHKEQATKLERIMACQASEFKRLIDLYGAAKCAVSPQGYTQLLRSP